MRYRLQPYKGPGTRHECPNCHSKHSFTYYIDANEYERGIVSIFGEEFGRCDNLNSCGYEKKPNGQTQKKEIEKIKKITPIPYTKEDVRRFRHNAFENNLAKFLLEKCNFDYIKLQQVFKDYCIGSTYNRGIIFWQIDEFLNIHRGKIMWYKEDGHREKYFDGKQERGHIQAMWSFLNRSRDIEPEMCYFGQHLCKINPDKPIALVESEKTALIAAYKIPEYNWIATSSIMNFRSYRLNFLKTCQKKEVFIFPDRDGYNDWFEKAQAIKNFFPRKKFIVNSLIIREGKDKEDLADLLLRL